MTLGYVDFQMPMSFVAAVEDAGLTELARDLRRDEFTISEVSEKLRGYPELLAEFAGFAFDWQTDNNFPQDEPPEYCPD
jgi:hypothetical protein